MIKVLFVCLGNICRSPMAEAVFRQKIRENLLEDKITIDSAGTGGWHIGKIPHEGTRDILTKNNINFDGMKARQVNQQDFSEFHYIIAMDTNNKNDLLSFIDSDRSPYLGKLLDFIPNSMVSDVPDPYYTGGFDQVYELVSEGCDHLLNFIKNRESL